MRAGSLEVLATGRAGVDLYPPQAAAEDSNA
jgi:hypothetical protein